VTDPAALTDEELAAIAPRIFAEMREERIEFEHWSRDALIVALRASRAENERLRISMARSRLVADHWRASIMLGDAKWAAHPLCMVLAAMDGESDPAQCGLTVEAAEAFRSLG
jgi:hypothetical protein